ncbi:MAG TPA: hypothetical protein P5567_05470 [Kiritimatiellia bacterium]|nr:hypothetical protein [Kiritimatiellia bacterium]HRZ11887.1 hypothetical protein [Kiritimatiellia bacterium]HSA17307.1 hypothetical protein [Kiritimatiellia bacterium]
MIWTSATNGEESLVGELRAEVARVAPDADEASDDVARGVAAFWRERYDRQWLSSDYVEHLIAAAWRGVENPGGPGSPARSLEAWRGLASRLYRSAEWAGGDRVWILDLGKVGGLPCYRLELLWFPVVRRLIEDMAELWDATGGHGVLGVVGGVPAGISGRALRRWRADLAGHGEAVLARLRRQRGWAELPRLLWMDPVSGHAGD